MGIALLLAAAAALQPANPDWQRWTEWEDGAIGHYDSRGIERDGDVRRLWVRFDFSRVAAGTEPDQVRVSRVSLACTARTIQVTYSIGYDAEGRTIGSDDTPTEVEAIREHSMWEILRGMVCGTDAI